MIRKLFLLLITFYSIIGLNDAQETNRLIQYELSAHLGNNQIILEDKNFLKARYPNTSKSFSSGIAFDFGIDMRFPLGRHRIKSGIHFNNWSSKVQIEQSTLNGDFKEEGSLSISRITIPIIFTIGKTNVGDFLQLSHELGVLLDYNLNFASTYFNTQYFERGRHTELFLTKRPTTKLSPGYRFHYGLRSHVNDKLALYAQAIFGYSKILTLGTRWIGCGTGMTQEQLDDLSRMTTFQDILSLNTSVGLSYRIFN